MDSTGTVEVGGPAGCLHGDFNRDLTNASGQAQHSLAQGVMLVQWALVRGWLTVFGLLGGHWYSLHFLMWIFFLLSLLIVGLWRMPSAVCQNWGNVWRSNNASVLILKWWKQPAITGIIKAVRGSSVDGFVYCAPLRPSTSSGSASDLKRSQRFYLRLECEWVSFINEFF